MPEPEQALVQFTWRNTRLWLRSITVTALKFGVPAWLLFSAFVLAGMPGPFLWFGSRSPLWDSAQMGLIVFMIVAGIGLLGYVVMLLLTLAQRLFRR